LEVYNTILSLEKARGSMEAQTRTAELAERTYRLTEEAYRAGFQDLLEVENAELQLRQARLGVLQQNFTYLQGLIDLEYAVGAPFGSLSAGAGGLGNAGKIMESME
jgi:outer membrane protein TolC